MTAPSKSRASAGEIADLTSGVTVDLYEKTGQWSVWIPADEWWGVVDADVLEELATHADVYGVTVTRRHDGQPWTPGLTALPAQLVQLAHDGLQLATATVSTDLPDGAFRICLSSGLSAHETVNALRWWLEEITVHDAVFDDQADAAGFVRLTIRGALPDGTRLVVVGLFHPRTAPNTVRIIRDEITHQTMRRLLNHLVTCGGRDTCIHR